jgi:CBS domain-containing protein
MTCREVMTENPKCCAPTDTAARVAKIMKIENVGSVPVCEDRHSKKIIGVITDRDLTVKVVAKGSDPNNVEVKDVMTRNPITCNSDEDLERAMESMEQHQVRRIPVVANGGTLVGIITQADIAMRSEEPRKIAEVLQYISKRSLQPV